jgi:EmrB/QacA subfamily drug resistance transporter
MTQTQDRHNGSPPEPFDRAARAVIVVVVLGIITTVLDVTIVSVALDRLATDFAVSLTTVQWVMTGYLLAFTAAIPLTGWAVDRYGARAVWLSAVGLFTAGSLLCGLAWSAESLIGFRVVQGFGAGMVSPVGITMVARAVGQHRMGRAMAVVGIPMMLGPILGPVIGGFVIDLVAWRWIFLLNLPVGVACLALSLRVVAREPGQHRERLDVRGLALLSPGLVAFVYGVTSVSSTEHVDLDVIVGIVLGVSLLGAFVLHALRTDRPLVDLRLFRHRAFTVAVVIQFLGVGVLTGAMFLLPLFYLVARGETELVTGLMLVPQGVGAAIAMAATGKVVDRGHGRAVVLGGLAAMVSGFVGYTQVAHEPSAAVLSGALFLIGVGAGCLFAPTSAAAYGTLERADIARATAAMSIVQRAGGAIATAVFAVVLQSHLTGTTNPAEAFGASFWWPLAVAAIAVLPALMLPRPATHGDESG